MTKKAQRDLSFAALRDANSMRCEASFHPVDDWTLNDWLGAATGELGEAANVIKENRRRAEHRESAGPRCSEAPPLTDDERQRLAHEIADTVIYLDLLAQRARIDLGAAVREKFNIVSERESVQSCVKL